MPGEFEGGIGAITPHDTNELSTHCRAIYVGSAGNVTLVSTDDSTLVFNNLPAGFILDVQTKIVKSTGTTSGIDLVGLY